MNKKVFIAWNGDNLPIAKKVGNLIDKHNFTPIVGGGSSSNRFVGDTVIKQMNQAEIAVIIIERVSIDKTSFKISENVMYEWGYLNAKINDPEKIRIFLINTSIDDLPSDVKGFWVSKITKKPYISDEERENSFNEVSKKISEIFLEDINKIKQPNKDKLQYLAHWDEYKHEIYNYDGYSQILEKLLYGMQAAIYSNEIEHLVSSLSKIECNSLEMQSVINCVRSMLSVFKVTNRFTKNLSRNDYDEIKDLLNNSYESNINDTDLKIWCEILRKDKLQLCHEFAADSFTNPKRYLEKSLKQGLEVIELINRQLIQKPTDKYYASLYLAFQYRNLSEVFHRLYELSPNEYSLENEKEYRELSYKTRDELRKYYRQSYGDDIIFDNLLQEYILSLIEFYPFVIDKYIKEDMVNSVQSLTEKWKVQVNRRNYIFDEINEKATSFMNIERK